ncbi:MAG: hypothetical protein ACLUD2_14785 [Clostridium sp.]
MGQEMQIDSMIKAMFGGHRALSISDKTFEKMVEANNGMTGFHIHVAEGMNDVYDSLRNYGCRPVNRLLYNGILGEKTLLGHCIHISPAEYGHHQRDRHHGGQQPASPTRQCRSDASPVLQMMARASPLVWVPMLTPRYVREA